MINFIAMYAPWFWLAVMVLCIVIEALTLGLTTIWAAIAALPMIFVSRTGLGLQWQLLIFVVLTAVLVGFTRPIVVKKLKAGKEKTNVNTLEGEEVLVVKTVSQFSKGEAKTRNGVIWTCQSASGKEIPEGTTCKIVKVEGNTLLID